MDKICWIRAFRLRHRVTIAELAFCAGISSQLLSLIELDSGRQSPQHEAMLRRACAALMSARHAELAQMEAELSACPNIFTMEQGEPDGACNLSHSGNLPRRRKTIRPVRDPECSGGCPDRTSGACSLRQVSAAGDYLEDHCLPVLFGPHSWLCTDWAQGRQFDKIPKNMVDLAPTPPGRNISRRGASA